MPCFFPHSSVPLLFLSFFFSISDRYTFHFPLFYSGSLLESITKKFEVGRYINITCLVMQLVSYICSRQEIHLRGASYFPNVMYRYIFVESIHSIPSTELKLLQVKSVGTRQLDTLGWSRQLILNDHILCIPWFKQHNMHSIRTIVTYVMQVSITML